jgi:RNA polymerase sigma factor (sigma-70 family)
MLSEGFEAPSARRPTRALMIAARSGDPRARRALVERYQPLIGAMASRYRAVARVDRSELMQEGVVGLLRALQRFDLRRDTPFWAYASWWVRQAMQGLVAEVARPVVLSDRALRQLARVREAQRSHAQRHRHDATPEQLAAATGFSVDHVQRLMALDRAPRALEEPVNAEEGSTSTFGDTLADPRSEDVFERVVEQLAGEKLTGLPGDLCERERAVLRARFGLGCSTRTLREIASEMDVSAERVRQIEHAALDKLRATADAA